MTAFTVTPETLMRRTILQPIINTEIILDLYKMTISQLKFLLMSTTIPITKKATARKLLLLDILLGEAVIPKYP
jgi:hypothetical protein